MDEQPEQAFPQCQIYGMDIFCHIHHKYPDAYMDIIYGIAGGYLPHSEDQ